MEIPMKLFASILLTLSVAAVAAAQTYTAYSVTDLANPAGNVYTATVHVSSNKTSPAPIFSNGAAVTITTTGCGYVPAEGDSAIVSNGPLGRTLLFSSGASCAVSGVTNVVVSSPAPSKTPLKAKNGHANPFKQ